MKKMRILIISDEEWNDQIHGNNVLSNWFSGFDAEFAQIYASPGLPYNDVCNSYFRITDSEMAKSILGNGKAGQKLSLNLIKEKLPEATVNLQRVGFYSLMKKISLYCNTPILMIRDFIWQFGRYDMESLKQFVEEFNPDIVFCPRLLTPKLIRLENTVSNMTNAPFIAFTADDEASLKEVSYSPLYWIRRLLFRKKFKKHISLYKHYFTFSQEQADEYSKEYGVNTSTLFKCGNFEGVQISKIPNNPIKLVYAGRLYCNRWKTLAEIGKALRVINEDSIKAELYVYTMDTLSKKQSKVLSCDNYIHVMGGVKPEELKEIYKHADIALHVESFDKKYKYATRVSFSTKIIDLMSSSCAIMAICWERHAGYQYLKEHDAAFCISDNVNILETLKKIISNTNIIQEYANIAWECGKTNHDIQKIQNNILIKFKSVISN